MRAPVATAVAIGLGIVALLGYFVPLPFLVDIQSLLLSWAVILAAVAALVAIFNLVRVHVRKLRGSPPKQRGDAYSLLVLAGFAATFLAGLLLTPDHPQFQQAVLAVQTPVETSLIAVLAVTLAYASLRLLQRRPNWMGILFAFSAVFFLILASGALSGLRGLPLLGDLLGVVERLPLAGARGLLLGIGLGSLLTGLRILMGADRPYSG
mgnify:FL=1